MRVWVVGSAGMLGKGVCAHLLEKGIACVGTERTECDITDPAAVKCQAYAIKPTHIINCAAYTAVDLAESEPECARSVNACGPSLLAQVATALGARLIHISTDYVFDGNSASPLRESDRCSPVNTYGKTKHAGEKNVLIHAPRACIIRTSWLFGKGGKNFLSHLVQWLDENEEVRVVSDQINRPTYVPDLAEAIVNLLDAEGVYHFANGHPLSRYEMARDIMAHQATRCQRLIPVALATFPCVAKRPLYTALDTTKVTAVLGYAPRSWKEILTDYLESAAYVC